MKRYVIDRFEGEYALLEAEDGGMKNVKKDRLPSDVKEGDVLTGVGGVFTFDAEETQARAEKVKGLMKGFFDE